MTVTAGRSGPGILTILTFRSLGQNSDTSCKQKWQTGEPLNRIASCRGILALFDRIHAKDLIESFASPETRVLMQIPHACNVAARGSPGRCKYLAMPDSCLVD